jgi:hypothetical protein
MMDKQSTEQWAETSRAHAQECLERISSGAPDAAHELAQIFMSRVAQKDVEMFLLVIEALARQSASLGCQDAKDFLETDWPQLRPTLKRRYSTVFGG